MNGCSAIIFLLQSVPRNLIEYVLDLVKAGVKRELNRLRVFGNILSRASIRLRPNTL